LSLFLIYLTFVFLYDMIWLFANRKQDSAEEIKTWAWVCSVVCLFSGCAFLLTKHVFGQTDGIAEAVSLAVFGAYLVIDLAELMFGSPIITKWILKHLIPRSMLTGTSTKGQMEV